MKKYGVGIIGCGRVWQYHQLALKHSDKIQCARVFDLDADRAREASKLTGANPAATVEEVFDDDRVDIVSVLTPAHTHAEIVEKAAAAGKHLMLEKPMAASLDDAIRISRAIRDAGVRCFHPTLRALVKDLFEKLSEPTAVDGPLGPVRGGFHTVLSLPFKWASWFADRRQCLPYASTVPMCLTRF